VTELVISSVLPSSKVPVAVICSVVPRAKEGFAALRRSRPKSAPTGMVAEAIENRSTATAFRQLLAGRAIGLPRGPDSFMIYQIKALELYQIRENLKGLPYERETDPCGLL